MTINQINQIVNQSPTIQRMRNKGRISSTEKAAQQSRRQEKRKLRQMYVKLGLSFDSANNLANTELRQND